MSMIRLVHVMHREGGGDGANEVLLFAPAPTAAGVQGVQGDAVLGARDVVEVAAENSERLRGGGQSPGDMLSEDATEFREGGRRRVADGITPSHVMEVSL